MDEGMIGLYLYIALADRIRKRAQELGFSSRLESRVHGACSCQKIR